MFETRVLSGMRPTGALHLGHYHGVLKNWVKLQAEHPCLFFVADWHALTTDYEKPGVLQDIGADVLQRAGLLVVGGERVPVGDEEQAGMLRLQPDPVLQHAVVVAQVQGTCGAHAGEDTGFEHRARSGTACRASGTKTRPSAPG